MVLSNTAVPREYGAFRDAVLRGEIPVNEEVSLQMNLIDFLIESPDYYYDDSAIDGFIRYCESELTLTDGSDLILLPSFRLWAEDLLSWYYFEEEKTFNPNTKRYEMVVVKRRLRNKQYLIVARGGAKSMYASMIQSYMHIIDSETTHQIVTAPTMKQSEETMSPIRTAITRARGPLFKFMTSGNKYSRTHTKTMLASTKKGIENFMTNSLIEVRPMSVDKLQGLRTKVATVDEWLSGDIKEDVIGAIEQGASKLKDYVIVATSSEGTQRDKVGDTIKMELLGILRGEIWDPHTSIWYYRLDDISEVGKPEMWLKANPNLCATVSYTTYQRDVDRAEDYPPSRHDILAKRFGIPVEGLSYFFTFDETIPHNQQSFYGMPCSLGADLSQGDDFCAYTMLFPIDGRRFGVKTRSYVSEVKMMKVPKAMKLKYEEFIAEGTLVVMEGPILDMQEVEEDLYEYLLANQYTPMCLGYDPYNAEDFLRYYTSHWGGYGIEKVRQGVRTESVPLGELKNLASQRLLLFDEGLMKFAMGNSIVIEDNNGNLKLSKRRASEKIDNVAALMDAWVAYKRNQEVFM